MTFDLNSWLLSALIAAVIITGCGMAIFLRWVIVFNEAINQREDMSYRIDRAILDNHMAGPMALALEAAIELVTERKHASRIFWGEAPAQDYDVQLRAYMPPAMFEGFFPERDLPFLDGFEKEFDQYRDEDAVNPVRKEPDNDNH